MGNNVDHGGPVVRMPDEMMTERLSQRILPRSAAIVFCDCPRTVIKIEILIFPFAVIASMLRILTRGRGSMSPRVRLSSRLLTVMLR
jgi:hypothetical protein